MSFKVTASTIGQSNPSPVTMSGGYRYRGIAGWNPSAGVHGEVTAPQPSACREVNEGKKAARFSRFCELRAAGVAVLRAAQDPDVNVQPKTARVYEAERLAQKKAAS